MSTQAEATYLLAVTDWSLPYSLSIRRPKDGDDPYWEYRALEVIGNVDIPSFSDSPSNFKLTLWSEPRMNRSERSRNTGAGVGWVGKEKATLTGGLYVPEEFIGTTATALAAGKVRYIFVSAAKIRYRREWDVLGFSFAYSPSDEDRQELLPAWRALHRR